MHDYKILSTAMFAAAVAFDEAIREQTEAKDDDAAPALNRSDEDATAEIVRKAMDDAIKHGVLTGMNGVSEATRRILNEDGHGEGDAPAMPHQPRDTADSPAVEALKVALKAMHGVKQHFALRPSYDATPAESLAAINEAIAVADRALNAEMLPADEAILLVARQVAADHFYKGVKAAVLLGEYDQRGDVVKLCVEAVRAGRAMK